MASTPVKKEKKLLVTLAIGNFKVQVLNAIIAEGGFCYVYLARDAIHVSKQYALKHIICNDEESLELVMKEISVIKSHKGHPNIVTLRAHTILDMGRTKEALLLMEYCEKSLVNVLESRGAGFFEEKQILQIFRDVYDAVFVMHCKTPPIAHQLRIFCLDLMDYGSCVILVVPLLIISALRSQRKWELRKIISGSTQYLHIEPLRCGIYIGENS